jgi:hypothetical protein
MAISECEKLCLNCKDLTVCLRQISANDNDEEGIIRLPRPSGLLTQAAHFFME